MFWNQTYSDWQQVHIPANVPHNTDNPHQKLDFYRFISASACSYAKMQSDIIRKYKKPGDFVTTNGWFENLNSHQLVLLSNPTPYYMCRTRPFRTLRHASDSNTFNRHWCISNILDIEN